MKDLHIHTKYSDGEYDENEILKKINDAGILEFAICDHDTLEGSKRISEILKKQNTNLIFHSGAELSSRVSGIFGGVNVHLLVRDFDYNESGINVLVNEASLLRKKRIQRLVDCIADAYGIRFSKEEIEETKRSTNTVAKPHMYRLLCKYGNFSRQHYSEIMRANLREDDLKLDAKKVLELVHNGKGNVTLAHPKRIMVRYNLTYKDIDKLVEYLKSLGLDGLETEHSSHTRQDINEFKKIAKKYNLCESRGSDFHGENVKPNIFLGVCEKKEENSTAELTL